MLAPLGMPHGIPALIHRVTNSLVRQAFFPDSLLPIFTIWAKVKPGTDRFPRGETMAGHPADDAL